MEHVRPAAANVPAPEKKRARLKPTAILGLLLLFLAILAVGTLAQIRDPRALARVFEKKGYDAAALWAYEWATTSFPDKPWPLLDLALAQARAGKDAEARATLEKLLAIEPGNGGVGLEAGTRLLAMNRYEDASVALAHAALEAEPKRTPVEALDKLVFALVKAGKPEEAEKAVDRAAARGLEGDLAVNVEGARAILAALKGERESAEAQAAALAAKYEKSPVARLQAAQVYAILAEKDAAMKELAAVPALLPFPHPCWYERELDRTQTLASVKDHPGYAEVAERSRDWRKKP